MVSKKNSLKYLDYLGTDIVLVVPEWWNIKEEQSEFLEWQFLRKCLKWQKIWFKISSFFSWPIIFFPPSEHNIKKTPLKKLSELPNTKHAPNIIAVIFVIHYGSYNSQTLISKT